MALFTTEEREQIVTTVTALLSDDDRIAGVALVGSLLGDADRWSDVDLAAVVTPEADAGVVASDWLRRAYAALPVVHHFETVFGTTIVTGLLLDNILEVDVSFTPDDDFDLWGSARPLFDRDARIRTAVEEQGTWKPEAPNWHGEAGFAWHDVLHACTAARRDKPWQALWYLQRVRNRTLALAQERRGFFADFFDYADDLPDEELAPLEGSLVSSLDKQNLLAAIRVATRCLIAELRRGAPELAARLEGSLLEYVDLEGNAGGTEERSGIAE